MNNIFKHLSNMIWKNKRENEELKDKGKRPRFMMIKSWKI